MNTIGGAAGNDSLVGGLGSDLLYGDAGNDVLDGGCCGISCSAVKVAIRSAAVPATMCWSAVRVVTPICLALVMARIGLPTPRTDVDILKFNAGIQSRMSAWRAAETRSGSRCREASRC